MHCKVCYSLRPIWQIYMVGIHAELAITVCNVPMDVLKIIIGLALILKKPYQTSSYMTISDYGRKIFFYFQAGL